MFNQCQFIGNLGADPEIKSFDNGGRIANLRLAVSETWKDKATGEKKERTEWVSVAVASDGLVGVVERYLRKGSKVFVSGKMRTRKWQDASGNDRYTTEVSVAGFDGKLVMLDGPKGGSGGGDGWSGGASGGGSSGGSSGGNNWGAGGGSSSGFGGGDFDNDLDDDVPF